MRVIFENLHENSFLLRSAEAIASGRKPWPAKHGNILDYYLANQKKIYIYINEKGSWFADGTYSFLNNEFMRVVECYVICKINKIPWRKIVILKEQDIRKDDILITYLFSLGNNINHLSKIHCYKVLDMNHFYARIPQLRFLPFFDCLVSESDIFSDSKLLNSSSHYEKSLFDTLVIPYTFRKRFIRKIPFCRRKNKAIATGTYEILHGIKYRELRSTYHVNCLHPMRMSIYCHREEWSEYIDSKITLWPDDELNEETTLKAPRILKFLPKSGNRNYPKHLVQKKYYSFNMVDLYNDYKMAIIGEEITGTPAVGFVEAMACGCAFIGLERNIYEKYGMKSGVHYIGYDGSSEDMLRKISYYQSHGNELERIAENGYQFAIKKFNGEAVARDYYRKICFFAKIHFSERSKENREL